MWVTDCVGVRIQGSCWEISEWGPCLPFAQRMQSTPNQEPRSLFYNWEGNKKKKNATINNFKWCRAHEAKL